MKRMTTLLLTAVLLLSLIACGAKDAWQEQYDLGMRCLNDGNYEEAVIAFTAAIEIDAKRPEAYLGAAEAYIAADDIDAAIAILKKGYEATGDQDIGSKLEEISGSPENDIHAFCKKMAHYPMQIFRNAFLWITMTSPLFWDCRYMSRPRRCRRVVAVVGRNFRIPVVNVITVKTMVPL